MPKYLFVANYSPEGVRGVVQEGGSGRRTAVEALAKSVGGSMESFYYAFGSDDAFVICDLPSPEAAAAVGLAVSGSGKASVRTVVLLTPEQIDEAGKLTAVYRAPGS